MNEYYHWKKYLVEAAVIVVSILMAFAIDAAWQYRQENIREKNLLSSILNDMEKNAVEIQRVIDINLDVDRSVYQFLKATPEALSALTDRDSAIEFLGTNSQSPIATLIGSSSFTPFMGSLTDSNLADIQNWKMRNELGSWLGLSADVVEATPRSYEESELIKRAASKFGASVLLLQSRGIVPETMPEGIPTFGEVFSALRANDDFISAFLVYHNQRMGTSRKLTPLSESTGRLMRLLRENN